MVPDASAERRRSGQKKRQEGKGFMRIEGYPYLYETHLHTVPGSACAHNTGAEMVRAAMEMGYAGIIVTDHNWGGNTGISRELPWERWVDEFITGYLDACEYGRQRDFDVFWGYEAGYRGTEFLIYGITPEWLKAHPEMRDADIREQYEKIHEAGGMVIHAHPFREEWYIPEIRLYPELVDGVEGINATHSSRKSTSHNDPAFDQRAIEYARKNGLPITAGSDIHSTSFYGGGVAFRRRLSSVQDYCRAILGGEDYVLTNGDSVYDRSGNFLYELAAE